MGIIKSDLATCEEQLKHTKKCEECKESSCPVCPNVQSYIDEVVKLKLEKEELV